MSVLTTFEEGEMYRNRIGPFTVLKIAKDRQHMKVFCIYDGKTREFDLLIAQLIIHNMKKEGIYD